MRVLFVSWCDMFFSWFGGLMVVGSCLSCLCRGGFGFPGVGFGGWFLC